MDGYNKAILVGNLGADPDLRMGSTGNAVMSLNLATTESRKVHEEWKEFTEWHRVKVFGRRAEGLAKVLSKGERIFVEGRISTREYEKSDGTKAYSTEILADKVILLGSPAGRPQRQQETRYDADDDGRPSNDEPRFRRG